MASASDSPYLWEQITASIDPAELGDVRRVVGGRLVSACEDMYAEVRALQEILSEFEQSTDELLEEARAPFCESTQPPSWRPDLT